MTQSDHIYPIFGEILGRAEKENLLGQKGMVFWLTGLSGSGKSTLARNLEKQLHQKGYLLKLLDGDNLRTGLNRDLGFSEADRSENIRRVAEIAHLFVETGVIVVCSFISPTIQIRQEAKEIIGDENFFEIFIQASLETCEKRDVKGLYKKARAGEIRNFTGIDAPFEAPHTPALCIETGKEAVGESVSRLEKFVLSLQKA